MSTTNGAGPSATEPLPESVTSPAGAVPVVAPDVASGGPIPALAVAALAQHEELPAMPQHTPGPWLGTLTMHCLGVLLVQAVGQAAIFILPVIAKKQMSASEWQVLLITAPPTVFFVSSIFWGGFFARLGFVRSAFLYFLVACLPLLAISRSTEYLGLLIPHLVASLGGAAWPVLSGSMLRSLYDKPRQSRAYSIAWGVSMLTSAGLGYLVGDLLTKDPSSYRIYLPIAVGLQLLGVLLLVTVGRSRVASMGQRVGKGGESGVFEQLRREVLDPILHMGDVLRGDRTFARYEGAYMTYGVGWMIGYALLPILATNRLKLNYEQFARSTHVAYLLALVACLYPCALLLDRLGAMRSTAISFLMLSLYPVGLLLARDQHDLLWVSAYYGVAHAGASVGWMLGPVSLAPSAEKVPGYVAIHATLVGLRGAIFQFVGVALYRLTDSFTWPLLLAALAYVWAWWQMWSLARDRDRASRS